jgi:hypothetical protein
MNGIAATLTSWRAAVTQLMKPPRAAYTELVRGATIGAPGDKAQQRRVLEVTLGLLAQDAPVDPVYLDETPRPE